MTLMFQCHEQSGVLEFGVSLQSVSTNPSITMYRRPHCLLSKKNSPIHSVILRQHMSVTDRTAIECIIVA